MNHKLAVLASGSGTLLDAIVDDGIEVSLVVVDRDCLAITKAQKYNIPVEVVNRADFGRGENFRRIEFSQAVVDVLHEHNITFVCMAGWMSIFEQPMFDAYGGNITNNHPSLLPSFKGEHAVADALKAGVKVTGCTIHIATLALDAGPILDQAAVRVLEDDDEESLHERIKVEERRLLPKVLRAQLGW